MRELTVAEVESIRRRARTPGVTYLSLAIEYGVDVGHIRFIANRETK